ncbi:PRC-barrel domain containing protein [uncultured Bosea sp.]|uniref:PRC-barrel domain containing protein n=1 Tax=uncultured Bosea sp. TaxID=211457 RepID=UPI0025ECEB32|nr:PRC-barrel domain containing protein [uncultured Bosea sp.]
MNDPKRMEQDDFVGSVLDGAPLFGPDKSKIGTVAQIHGKGEAMQVIVSLGGILGIGAKIAVLGRGDLQFERGEDGSIRAMTQLTSDQLAERSPI